MNHFKKKVFLLAIAMLSTANALAQSEWEPCDSDDFMCDDSWHQPITSDLPELCDSDDFMCDDSRYEPSRDDAPEPCDSDDIFCRDVF